MTKSGLDNLHLYNTRLLILWHLSDTLRPYFSRDRAESLDLWEKDFQKLCVTGLTLSGTGKTYASAFAMRELGFDRVLFLVHRNQLAIQPKLWFGMTATPDKRDNIANALTNEFPAGSGKKTYEQCVFIEKSGDDYKPKAALISMLQHKEFYDIIDELLDFGISRYERDYSRGYGGSDLVLYQKYTYEDVCRLLDLETTKKSSITWGQ